MANVVNVRQLAKDFAERNNTVPQLQFISEKPDDIIIEDVTGMGQVNRIYLIKSQSDQRRSVILKYAGGTALMENLKEMSLERQDTEFYSLNLVNGIVPGAVPQPYCFDKQLHLIAMEDMCQFKHLGTYIQEHGLKANLASRYGTLLGQIHYQTHRNIVSKEIWNEMATYLKSTGAKETIGNYRFCKVYNENEKDYFIPEELHPYHERVAKVFTARDVPNKVMEMYMRQECFVHSDLHHYSSFVSEERIAIFDAEYASLGHPAFDLGMVLMIFYLCFWDAHPKNELNCKTLKEQGQESLKTLSMDLFSITAQKVKYIYVNETVSYLAAFEGNLDVLGDWEMFVSDLTTVVGATVLTASLFEKLGVFFTHIGQQREYLFKKGADILNKADDIRDIDTLLEYVFAESHEEI